MKNIRAKLKDGCDKHTINVFKNADDACTYSNGVYETLNTLTGTPSVRKVTLIEDDFLEAEWIGCEYKYEKNNVTKVNNYRIVKAADIHNELGMLISMYEGWVLDADLPHRKCETASLDINTVDEGKQMFDFSALFNDIDVIDDFG